MLTATIDSSCRWSPTPSWSTSLRASQYDRRSGRARPHFPASTAAQRSGPSSWSHSVRGQVLLGELMLALTTLAVDDRDLVGIGPSPHPTSEPAGHPHQMRVVQLLITTAMQPPPPHPKPTRVMTQREVGIKHDAIHAVITAGQQIAIAFGELVTHRDTVVTPPPPRSPAANTAPSGAIPSERGLGRDVGAWDPPIDKKLSMSRPCATLDGDPLRSRGTAGSPVQPNIAGCRTSGQKGRRDLVSSGDHRATHRRGGRWT